jgi:plasmid stabilization system protein ParE
MTNVERTEAAKRDLMDLLAERFLDSAEDTLRLLARWPLVGRVWLSRRKRLRGVRILPILRFRQFVVLYLPETQAVRILLVLRGARDAEAALLEDHDLCRSRLHRSLPSH